MTILALCTQLNGAHSFPSFMQVGFFHTYRDGVDFCFVDHPVYHRDGTPYGDANGTFGDNQFRFTLLTLASLEAPLCVPFGGAPYGDDVMFMANDWQVGYHNRFS